MRKLSTIPTGKTNWMGSSGFSLRRCIVGTIACGLISFFALASTSQLGGEFLDLSSAHASQSQADRENRDPRAPPIEVEQRQFAVLDELSSLQEHRWAGEYYEGDGLGANILMSLAPDAGVAATWHGCLGLYGADEGSIQELPDGALSLRFNAQRPVGQLGRFPDSLVPVHWGARSYLIPSDRMIDFVNDINHGNEPRDGAHGFFLLKVGDEALPVSGLPDLPARYRSMIRSTPIDVGIREIRPAIGSKRPGFCTIRYDVTLDHGSVDGIVPGVTLEVVKPASVYGNFEVIDANPGSATAKFEVFESDCAAREHMPKLDWRLSTGAYTATFAKE